MKHATLVLAVLLVLIASPVFAAVQVNFTDGSTTVWNDYTVKGNSYCTRLSFGEICFPRSDVKSFSKAPAENAGNDYGLSVIGNENAASKSNDLGEILSKSEAEDRAFKSQRDKEQYTRSKQEEKRIKNNRAHGKADWAL